MEVPSMEMKAQTFSVVGRVDVWLLIFSLRQ
jgi:hypothetical protein